jgi:hypothetical protein
VIYLLALLPATALTIGGYLVLYLSSRSEGALRTFGKYLGFWAFTLAGLVILGALFAAARGGHGCPGYGMRAMHGGRHCPWAAAPAAAPGTNPASPAAAPTAAEGASPAPAPAH